MFNYITFNNVKNSINFISNSIETLSNHVEFIFNVVIFFDHEISSPVKDINNTTNNINVGSDSNQQQTEIGRWIDEIETQSKLRYTSMTFDIWIWCIWIEFDWHLVPHPQNFGTICRPVDWCDIIYSLLHVVVATVDLASAENYQ